MYVTELREYRTYLLDNTTVQEMKTLNLLGVQFAVCEASKYLFYLRYESGPLYKPSRDFDLILHETSEPEKQRLSAIWSYWQGAEESSGGGDTGVVEDDLHPDHHRVECREE